jgi:two-component sensor histidine kinase
LPEAFDLTSRSSTNLGMQLIRTLVRSLDGVIEAGSDGGAWFAVTFPVKPAHG